jgi:hypothetical protein
LIVSHTRTSSHSVCAEAGVDVAAKVPVSASAIAATAKILVFILFPLSALSDAYYAYPRRLLRFPCGDLGNRGRSEAL